MACVGKDFSDSKVAIVGIGTLGAFSAEILARAGVGMLRLIDFDLVDHKNLVRQCLYSKDDVGSRKVDAAKRRLESVSDSIIDGRCELLSDKNADDLLGGVDIVLDCTDNLDARNVIDSWCKDKSILWVHSAAVGSIGTVCVFGDGFDRFFGGKVGVDSCSSLGIEPSLPAIVAGFQTDAALSILSGGRYCGDILRINLRTGSIEKIKK